MSYIALAVAALLVGIDQVIKFIVDKYMAVGDSIAVWDGVLHWTYLQNRGAAFGIWQNQRWILVGLTSVLVIAGIVLLALRKVKSNFLIWSFALIVAGGLGNLIDRVFRHFVIDYVEIRLIHFAIFNFADCCVVIGTGMLIGYLLFGELIKKKREAKHAVPVTGAEPPAEAEGPVSSDAEPAMQEQAAPAEEKSFGETQANGE